MIDASSQAQLYFFFGAPFVVAAIAIFLIGPALHSRPRAMYSDA